MNTGLDLLSELRRRAEASGITVGVTLGDGEPSVQALGDKLRAWSRDNWRTGTGDSGAGRTGRVGRALRSIGYTISWARRAHGSRGNICGSEHGS